MYHNFTIDLFYFIKKASLNLKLQSIFIKITVLKFYIFKYIKINYDSETKSLFQNINIILILVVYCYRGNFHNSVFSQVADELS